MLVKRILLCLLLFLTTSVTMTQAHDVYHEPYRPQFHFSPICGWMNDPNGMVYYEGEYHFFFQYSPLVSRGPMHWGHAVSSDLVHWQTLPIALYPDAIGPIWSGSAVVDANNTSGLVPGGGLVAIFSYENQSQGIAYSRDRGRTWVKYPGNPVIPALAQDFRDPKVFWNAATQLWTMVLAVGHEAQFFTSPNLIDWEMRSRFAGGQTQGIWEVPDLFPLTIAGQTKWVLLVSVSAFAPAGGSGIQYFIGTFDGATFTNDYPDQVLWFDYGADNYAGTTWDNAPDDQRLYIGWLGNWVYAWDVPTTTWRGAATLPRALRLVQTSAGIRLAQSVPAAFAALRQPLGTWTDVTLTGDLPLDVQGRALEIIAEFAPGDAVRFGLDVQGAADDPAARTRIVYNAQREQLLILRLELPIGRAVATYTPAFGAPLPLAADEPLRLHLYVDESSVEVLAQDGLTALTAQTFSAPASAAGLAAFAEGGSATLKRLEVYALASVWTQSADEIAQAQRDSACP